MFPYIGYIDMASVRGRCFFKDILVKRRVSILVILVSHWVWRLHFSLELGRFFLEEATFFIIIDKTSN